MAILANGANVWLGDGRYVREIIGVGGMSEEFEEWKTWFDSHKDLDGTINLDKHPDLANYLQSMFIPPAIKFKDLPNNLGLSVNFDLVPKIS